jgi:transposase
VGYDAGKKVKGCKVHALVDTLGLPMRVVVHSAGIQDRDGAALVLDKIRNSFPWLELVWADNGYNAHQVNAAVAKVPALRLEIVKRTDDMKGFVVLPRRWVVERILGSSPRTGSSPGSAATGDWPRTGKTSPTPSRPSSPSPLSSSPSDASPASRLLSQALIPIRAECDSPGLPRGA